jgi:hypothetical protein
MTNATATIEPTRDQLTIIRSLERRMRSAIMEIVAVSEEVIALRAAGLETREAAEAVAWADNEALNELQCLRISHGIPAFSDWWFYRVRVLRGLGFMVDGIPDDDQGEDAALERKRHTAALAIEEAIAKADPELIGLLNRATPRPYAPHLDPTQLAAATGMTREDLADRAEIVLTQLIESGWRP